MISQDQKVAVSDQIAKTVAYLEKLNHGASSIARHCATWKKFGKYCETQNAEFFSVDLAMSFLSDVFGITESSALKSFQKVRRRHMRVLCDFFLCGHVVQKPQWRAYYFPPQCKHVFEAFMTLRREMGYSPRTEAVTILYLERFGSYLEEVGVEHFSEISSAHLTGFVDSQYAASVTKASMCGALSVLGRLFDFAAEKYHPENLSRVMPKSGYRRNRPLPSVYSREEVHRLLKAVDRGLAIGKRDYAILLLASKLGLRMGDICALRFGNFTWERNQIEIIQGKTGSPLVLPILPEVGEAIIDYLKEGRPMTDSAHIFIRHMSPFTEFSPRGMGLIVKKHLLNAGIKVANRKAGLHSLRHSLASALLKENTPLPIISEILGHTRTNTTRVYLKIGIDQLKRCALEVPAL